MLWFLYKTITCILFLLFVLGKSIQTEKECLFLRHLLNQKFDSYSEIIFFDNHKCLDYQYFVHKILQSNIQISFLDVFNMTNSKTDHLRYQIQNALVLISKEENLFHRQEHVGVLNSYTWLMPTTFHIPKTMLKLNSKVYQYSFISHESVILSEVYAIKKEILIRQEILSWTYLTGKFKWLLSENKAVRRSDLRGITLLDSNVPYTPYAIKCIPICENNKTFKGFTPDIVTALQSVLNFDLSLGEPPDNQYGVHLANGSWTGIVGQLDDKVIDFSSSGLLITQERLQVLDVSIAVWEDRNGFIMKTSHEKTVNMWAYVAAFHMLAWIMVAVACLSLIIVLYLAYNYNLDDEFKRISLTDAGRILALMLLQLDFPVLCNQAKWSTKLILASLFVFTYLVFVHFTSVMTSFMTVQKKSKGIETFEDILESGLNFHVLEGSEHINILKRSEEGSTKRQLYENIQNQRERFLSGYENIIDRLIQNDDAILFFLYRDFVGNEKLYTIATPNSKTYQLGFFFQKDSEFVDIFNHYLQKMNEGALIEKLWSKWSGLIQSKRPTTSTRNIEAFQIGYDNVLFPFALITCGITLSILILIMEWRRKNYVLT